MANDSILTFETLYDLLRKEKQESNLTKVDQDINEMFIAYLKNKISIYKKDKESMTQDKKEFAKKQINNIRRLYKELLEKREKKILELAYLRSKTSAKQPIEKLDNLLKEEINLLKKIENILMENREYFIMPIVNGQLPHEVPKPSTPSEPSKTLETLQKKDVQTEESFENITIRFTKDVPRFYGEDLTIYGPFKDGDIANIPKELAMILTSKESAEEIQQD